MTNKYEAIGLDMLGDEERARAATVEFAASTTPAQEAEAAALSQRTGAPVDAVRADPDGARKEAERRQLAALSPTTQRWLTENPNRYALVKDDVEQVNRLGLTISRTFEAARDFGLSSGWRTLSDHLSEWDNIGDNPDAAPGFRAAPDPFYAEEIARSLFAGYERGLGNTGFVGLPDLRSAETRQAAESVARGLGYESDADYQAARTGGFIAGQERRAQQIERTSEATDQAFAKIAAANETDSVWEALGLVWEGRRAVGPVLGQSVGMGLPGLAMTAATGGTSRLATAATAGGSSGFVEYGASISEALSEAGVDVTDSRAVTAALRNPAIMEKARQRATKRGVAIGLFDAVTAGLAGQLLINARRGASSAALRTGGEVGLQAGGGMAGEAAAQVATGEDIKLGDIIMEGVAGLPFSAVEGRANYVTARERGQVRWINEQLDIVRRSSSGAESLAAATAAAAESNLGQRSPAEAQAFARAAGAEGAVYIDAEVARTLFQSDWQVLVDAVGGDAALTEQLAAGDVAIPADQYFGKIAQLPYAADIARNARVQADALSAVEMESFDIDALADALAGDTSEAAERATPGQPTTRQRVQEDVYGQLISTGRYTDAAAQAQAKLWGAFFASMESRYGADGWAAYEQRMRGIGTAAADGRADPRSTRPWLGDGKLDALLDAIRSDAGPSQSAIMGPSLSAFVQGLGGISDYTGKLRGMGAGRLRIGLINAQGVPLDRAREAAAEAGYFGGNPEDAIASTTVSDLLDLLDRDLRDGDVFSDQFADRNRVAFEEAKTELQAAIDDNEYLRSMSNDEYRALTNQQIADALFGGSMLDQSALDFDQPAGVEFDESAFRPEVMAWAQERFGDLVAPNGRPAWQNFVAWFGDSQAVDYAGAPLVVYHGSPDARFMDADATFMSMQDRFGAQQGVGAFWFAESRRTASTYADDRRAFDYQNAEARIIPAFLSLQNPLIIDAKGQKWGDAQRRDATTTVIDEAIASGHDGVIIRNVRDDYVNLESAATTTFTVFDSRQIKSADANSGDFDPSNPNTLHQPAFHGTPHDVDRFSLQKIGTGEGAQAYGWGLYFASQRDIADFYRRNLTGIARNIPATMGDDALREAGGDRGRAIATLTRRRDALPEAARGNTQAAIDWIRRGQSTGRLYGVEVPDSDVLLNYDAPLSEQPENVKSALRAMTEPLPFYQQERYALPEGATFGDLLSLVIDTGDPEFTGGWLYQQLVQDLIAPNSAQAASEALLAAGIPGLQYLDGSTRNVGAQKRQALADLRKSRASREAEAAAIQQEIDANEGNSNLLPRFFESRREDIAVIQQQIEKIDADIASVEAEQGTYNFVIWDDAAVSEPVRLYQSAINAPTFYSAALAAIESGRGAPKRGDAQAWKGWLDGAQRRGEMRRVYIPFGENQVKSQFNRGTYGDTKNIMRQGGQQPAPRGQIQIYPDRSMAISLFETANRSTFLHETGHFFLEVLRDMAAADDAPQQARDDMAALLSWFGVESADQIAVEHHEQFARGFEKYLGEGRAPSPELQSAFSQFKAWLLSVYRSLVNLNVNLTDDVRGVMDRMLAADEEIEAAHVRQGMEPLAFADGVLEEAQIRQYADQLTAATERERAALGARLMAAHDRAARRWYKEQKAEVRKEVEAEYSALPVYRAARALAGAKTFADGTPIPDELRGMKLDRDALVDVYGEAYLQRIRGLYAREGGVDQDVAAMRLGFESGDALLNALANREDMAARVAAETDARMVERYGDPMVDGTLPERAMEAVHGDHRMRVLAWEMAVLEALAADPLAVPDAARPVRAQEGQAERPRPQVSPETRARIREAQGRRTAATRALAEVARRSIAKKTLREIRPNDYLVAERKAAVKAAAASARGSYAEALQAKRQQAFNAAMYRQAKSAQARAESNVRFLRKASSDATRARIGKQAGKFYVDALDAIFHGIEARGVSRPQVARRAALRDWVRRMQDEGNSTAVPEMLLARVESENVTNLADMTVGDVEGLREAVGNILHLARTKNRLLTAKGQRDWEDVKAEMMDRLEQQPDRHGRTGISDADRQLFERISDLYAAGSNWVLQPETLVEWLDGATTGPFHDLLWDQAQAAERKREALNRAVGGKLQEALDALPAADRKALDRRFRVESLGGDVSGHSILSALLNMGNAGNRDKLTRGGRVVGDEIVPFTPEQLADMFAKLTRPQAEMVQKVWDAIYTLWPEIVALEESMNGIAPERVESTPVTVITRDGPVALRGGYYPAMYDPKGARAGQFSEDEQAKRVLSGQTPIRASTSKGHTEKRTDFAAPLLLDYQAVLTRHLDGVIGDIAYRQFLRQVYKVLGDADIRRMIDNRVGPGAAVGLRKGFERGATGNFSLAGPLLGPFQRVADATMTNLSSAALGFRIPLALANVVAVPLQAAARVPYRYVLRGLRDYYLSGGANLIGNMRRNAEMVQRLSPLMLRRSEARSVELSSIIANLRGQRGFRAKMIEMAMSVHQWTVPLAENAIWMGAYQQAADAGATPTEAVTAADKAIRQTQTKTSAAELSQGEGGYMRMFMQFAGPLVIMNNRMQEAGLRGLRGDVHSWPQALGVWFAVAMGAAWSFELIMGRGPDADDDGEDPDVVDWVAWAAKKLALLPFAAFPMVRDAASYLDSGFSRSTPLVESMKSVIDTFGGLAESLFGDEEVDAEKVTKQAVRAAGVATGVPSNQLLRTGDYLMSVSTGEHEMGNPAAEAYYLVQGAPDED